MNIEHRSHLEGSRRIRENYSEYIFQCACQCSLCVVPRSGILHNIVEMAAIECLLSVVRIDCSSSRV